MTMQALVIAHAAYGHNHFFKNNYQFQVWTQPDHIIDYLGFAKTYVSECEERYGHDAVESVLCALPAALREAKSYVHSALSRSAGWRLGAGHGPLAWGVTPEGVS